MPDRRAPRRAAHDGSYPVGNASEFARQPYWSTTAHWPWRWTAQPSCWPRTANAELLMRSSWRGSVRRFGFVKPSAISGDSGAGSAAARHLEPTRPGPGQADPGRIGGPHPFSEVTSVGRESAEVIALSRYRIIGEATSSRLSPAERGRIVRELARHVYEHPDGSQRQY